MYGITGNLLLWIKNFLHGRSHRTAVGNCLSSSVPILSGVIQGSCLGPLLFLLYINDLPDAIGKGTIIKLFADDVKLYSSIHVEGGPSRSQAETQVQLNNLTVWAKTWQLPISVQKCCTLNITKRTGSIELTELFIGHHALTSLNQVSDLGVIFDANLTFSSHINHIASKGHSRANLILRSFVSKDAITLTRAFIVYVRPLLEYCTVVWSPSLVRDIDILEKVQRRFTKRLPGLQNLTYHQRLASLNLESLELRRLRSDLIFAYKLVFGLQNVNVSDFFEVRTNTRSRGHPYKLDLPTAKNRTRFNFFSYRVIRVWNALPTETVNFSSLGCFKKSLTSTYLVRFCKVYFK